LNPFAARRFASRENATLTERALPLVVIVGRPNVGKSTLFNRIVGRRRAIVTDEAGITRDRIHAAAEWRGRAFEVVDTGGLVPDERAEIPREIFRQAKAALDRAARVVLVTDARAGLVPLDRELALRVRRMGKPLIVAANKVDRPGQAPAAAVFYELGAEVFPVSAEHGLGVDELLDAVTRDFVSEPAAPSVPAVQVAIIGRPNVGKSTLLNRLVGYERAIVSAEPGTTRDVVDTLVRRDARLYRFIDTAGIRRKGKTKLLAEKLSVLLAHKHLERADVALLVADASLGVTAQDAAIAGDAERSGRSILVVMNKWDLALEAAARAARERDEPVPGAETLRREYERLVRERLGFVDYAPVLFLSALTGEGVERLFPLIDRVARARRARIPPEELSRWLAGTGWERGAVPRGRAMKIRSLEQVAVAPPAFLVRADPPGRPRESFARFLENRLRERFDFTGTPIRLLFRPARRGGPAHHGGRAPAR
jgi:GTP-binding protein